MDPSLAHIPVILLVGAFDPLDEQEAQRVGADGVLKKPFVPPDPLISMVKSALQRAGVGHGNASVAKISAPEVLKGTDLHTPSGASAPTVESFPLPMPSHEQVIAPLEQESFVDEVAARPEPLRIDGGSQPVAFGSLLETPTDEKDDELGYLQTNPELATERDWRDPDSDELEEEAEEEKPPAPWRHEEAGSYKDAGTTSGAKDWRAGSFEQILAKKIPVDSWAPAEDKPEIVETAPAASEVVKEKANKLAWAVDAAAPVATPPAGSNGTEKAAEAVSQATQQVIEEAALPAGAVEAIREEAAQVAEDATHVTEQHASDGTSFYAPEALIEPPVAAPEATPSMDDLVARVLARMSPEVLQAVTRENLKPRVETMG